MLDSKKVSNLLLLILMILSIFMLSESKTNPHFLLIFGMLLFLALISKKNRSLNLFLLAIMITVIFILIHTNRLPSIIYQALRMPYNAKFQLLLPQIFLISVSLVIALIMKTKKYFLYYILPCILIGRTGTTYLKVIFFELSGLIAFYALIILLITLITKTKNRLKLRTGLELPILFFIFFCLISTTNAFWKLDANSTLLNFIIGFLFFFASFYLIKNKKDLNKLSWIILILGTLTALISLQDFILLKIAGDITQNSRINGLWAGHNLANIFNFFIPLAFAKILGDKKIMSKIIAGICLFTLIFALLLTNTRINLLTFIIITSLFFIFCNKKKNFIALIIPLIILSTVTYAVSSTTGFIRLSEGTQRKILERVDNTQGKSDYYLRKIDGRDYYLQKIVLNDFKCKESCLNPLNCDWICIPFIDFIPGAKKIDKYSTGRIYLIRRGLELFKLHPVLGIGFSSSQYYNNKLPFQTGTVSHNIFIEILAATGIFGFLAFLWLVIKTFKNDLSLFLKKMLSKNLLLLAFSMGSLTLIIDGLTQNGMFYWQINALFWIYRGVIHSFNLKN